MHIENMKLEIGIQKSRIPETLKLLACADISTDANRLKMVLKIRLKTLENFKNWVFLKVENGLKWLKWLKQFKAVENCKNWLKMAENG